MTYKETPQLKNPFNSVSVLFREEQNKKEFAICEKHFVTHKSRMHFSKGELVIGRYSVLPFYRELEKDLSFVGARLINSYSQHRFVADLQNYVPSLVDMTPKTWKWSDFPYLPDNTSYVIKGETNSKKFLWNSHMFAANKAEAVAVYQNLQQDSYIATQDIYIREFIPLEGIGEANTSSGPPISLEFRFFVAYGKIISGGFYWDGFVDNPPSPLMVPSQFLQAAIDKVKDNVNFFVIDVAKTKSGNWIVIELNDGQMSGLSANDPTKLYQSLKHLVWGQYQQIIP